MDRQEPQQPNVSHDSHTISHDQTVERLKEQLKSTQQQLAAKEEAYNDYVRSSGELEAELELQGKIQEGKIQELRNELTKNNGGIRVMS